MTAVQPTGFKKEAYLAKLAAAKSQYINSKKQALDWLENLDAHAALAYTKIESLASAFPLAHNGLTYRLHFEIRTTSKRYGCLGVSLRTNTTRIDLGKLDRAQLVHTFKPLIGLSQAELAADNYVAFEQFNQRLAGLYFLSIDIEYAKSRSALIPRWLETLHVYSQKCRPLLSEAFDEYESLTEQLEEEVFYFNSLLGPARYRSIRCTFKIDEADPLGPSDPTFKVITMLSIKKGIRRYTTLKAFKKFLKRKRISQQLELQLGREPSNEEVQSRIDKMRERAETSLITKEVIQACYMGRHIKVIFEAQENLAAVIEPWSERRAQLEALL